MPLHALFKAQINCLELLSPWRYRVGATMFPAPSMLLQRHTTRWPQWSTQSVELKCEPVETFSPPASTRLYLSLGCFGLLTGSHLVRRLSSPRFPGWPVKVFGLGLDILKTLSSKNQCGRQQLGERPVTSLQTS